MGDNDEAAAELGRLAVETGARVSALSDVHGDLVALRSSMDGLADAIGNLASKDEVEARLAATRRELSSKRVRSILAFAVAFVAVMTALVVVLAIVAPLRNIAEQNQDYGRALAECTTPGNRASQDPADRVHECYDEGQARTAAAVAAIVDADRNGRPDIQELREQLGTTTTTTGGGDGRG